jgi:ATP-dependent Clp protease, protease subunit
MAVKLNTTAEGDKKEGAKTNAKSWFAMRAAVAAAGEAPAKPAEIVIYDEIGAWGINATDFDRALRALGDAQDIVLRVNSPGGDVFDGLAIFNRLDQYPATITAEIDGIAASAASLIVMAADKIVAPENAFMLLHEPAGITFGTANDHLAMAQDLEKMTASFAGVYAKRAGSTPEAMKTLMAQDGGRGQLMMANEAKALKLIDEVGPARQLTASFDMARVPEKHRAAVAAVLKALAPAEDPEAKARAEAEARARAEAEAEARRQAEEAARAEAYTEDDKAQTLELCAIAKVPASEALKFIAAKTQVAEVRKRLADAAATADAGRQVDSTQREPQPATAVWEKAIERYNARVPAA